jgi:O-antigen ligase
VFLYEREYKRRFATVKNNPLVYIVIVFVLLHLVGFLWSENLDTAAEMFARVKKLLYLPILMMFIKKDHILYYFQAFIAGMMISEGITYLIWLDIIPPFMYANNHMPSALMRHFNYTVFVAMALFLLFYLLLYKKNKSKLQITIAFIFISTMLLNLMFSGGRAGQIGFFILIFVLIIHYFRKRVLKGLMLFSLASSILFTLAYNTIPLFQERADKAVYELTHFKPGSQNTSLGIRLGLFTNYYEIIKEHPFIGVGTGDYIDEYKKINKKSLYITPPIHPHNMYIHILTILGVVGLIPFLMIFAYQLYVGFKIKDDLQPIRIAFPLMFMAISMVYWYLYAFNTMLLFIVFSAILYRQFDKDVKVLE